MHLALRVRFFMIGAIIVLVCFLSFLISISLSRDSNLPGTDLASSKYRKVPRKAFQLQGKHGRIPKILCWILTHDKNLNTKARAVKDTWGNRCDKTLYFSTTDNASFPAIGLNVSEGRQHLSEKTFKAFIYCFHGYGDLFDWFVKADDDTYIIVENLRAFLSNHDPQEKLYFGYRFKPHTPQGFMSGGAGYGLSREALRSFVRHGILGRKCQSLSMKQMEDLDMGACLSHLGVRAMDTIDSLGRERFHPLNLISYIYQKYMPKWLHNYTMYPVQMGRSCCSEQTISFHYVRPPEMYIMDLLLYQIQVARTSKEYLLL